MASNLPDGAGYFKLWRRVFEHEIAQIKPHFYFKFLLWCVAEAAPTIEIARRRSVKYGTFETSMREIQNMLSIKVDHQAAEIPSRYQLLVMLEYCAEQKMLSSTKSGHKMTIHVLNFEKWQNPHKSMQESELEEAPVRPTLSDVNAVHFETTTPYTLENSEVPEKQHLNKGQPSNAVPFETTTPHTLKRQRGTLCVSDMNREYEVPTDLSFATLSQGQKSGDFDDVQKPDRKPQKKAAKRDDYIDAMTDFWKQITPGTKVPISLFSKWRSEHGPDVSLDIVQQVAMSGKKLKSAQGYIAKAISNEAADRRRKNLNEPTDSDFDDLRNLVEGD